MTRFLALVLLTLGARLGWASAEPAPVVLTLSECVDLAVQNATQVLQAGNQLALTGAQLLQAYGQFLPNLVGSASLQRQSGTSLYLVQGQTLVDLNATNAALSLSTTLNLFNGLSDYAGLKSAIARKSSLEASLQWSKEQVALDITQSYLQIILDRQLEEIAKNNLTASQSRLKLLQGQSRVGSASIPDLYRQQADASSNVFSVTNAESRLQNDQVLLLRKLRVDPSKTYRYEAPDLDTTPSELASQSVDQLITQTLEARSDVRSNGFQLEASHWDVTQARGGYWPHLDLVGTRNAGGATIHHEFVDGQDFSNQAQPGLAAQLGNQVTYTLGLYLSWNIFDRFLTHTRVEQSRYSYENSRINLDDSKLQVQADIQTSYVNYASARKQLTTAKVGVESAQKSYDATEGTYEVGAASLVDVLTAQAALVQARTNWALALINLKLQERTLAYATGGILAPAGAKAR